MHTYAYVYIHTPYVKTHIYIHTSYTYECVCVSGAMRYDAYDARLRESLRLISN
jgi:hypothetical protein